MRNESGNLPTKKRAGVSVELYRKMLESSWKDAHFIRVTLKRLLILDNMCWIFPVLDSAGNLGNRQFFHLFFLFDGNVPGKYNLDMDVYHRTIKPIFLTRFRGEYGTKKFNNMHASIF